MIRKIFIAVMLLMSAAAFIFMAKTIIQQEVKVSVSDIKGSYNLKTDDFHVEAESFNGTYNLKTGEFGTFDITVGLSFSNIGTMLSRISEVAGKAREVAEKKLPVQIGILAVVGILFLIMSFTVVKFIPKKFTDKHMSFPIVKFISKKFTDKKQKQCLKCGGKIIYAEGFNLAKQNGHAENAIMCPHCQSIFYV